MCVYNPLSFMPHLTYISNFISASTKVQLTLTPPDFSQHRVEDIFKRLGPVAVFSAKHQWSAPRIVKLTRTSTQGFGFSVRGDAPVVIAGVDSGSLAEVSLSVIISYFILPI